VVLRRRGLPLSDWPELPYYAWRDTRDTLHMYLQIVGKVRLALAPMEPQWAQVPLYVTARGLNTSPIPHANGVFDIDVDLIEHAVSVRTAKGALERVALEPRTVAEFYALLMAALDEAGVPVTITTKPSEVANPIPFPEDTEHASYEPEWANRWWRALVSVDSVLKAHRARFLGRVSPVQFFWGTFDLAYTRFSGRPAEPPPDADVIMRNSANAEEVCAGFWPGDERLSEPAFFAYAYPRPPGIETRAPGWNETMGEFVLTYETVRTAPDPRSTLLDFLDATYGAAGWDPALEAE
jgi:hypothetical protein